MFAVAAADREERRRRAGYAAKGEEAGRRAGSASNGEEARRPAGSTNGGRCPSAANLALRPRRHSHHGAAAMDLARKSIPARPQLPLRARIRNGWILPLVDSPVQRDSRETRASWTTSHARRLAKRRGELVSSQPGFFL